MTGCRAISGYGLSDCEACSMWTYLQPLAHQPAHQQCSGPSTAMAGQECAPSSSMESYAGCSRLPSHCTCRSTQLTTQFTPANFKGSNFTGQQITAHRNGHISDPISPETWGSIMLSMPKVLICCHKSQPWKYLFTLLSSLQKAEHARQKQQCKLLLSKTENHSVLSLLPGEVSPRGRMKSVLATRRDKAGGGLQPDFQTLCLWELHGALGKCSPGRKEHSGSKTNTKPEYFLLYFSFRSFGIQKRFEERAIIKPLMHY